MKGETGDDNDDEENEVALGKIYRSCFQDMENSIKNNKNPLIILYTWRNNFVLQ